MPCPDGSKHTGHTPLYPVQSSHVTCGYSGTGPLRVILLASSAPVRHNPLEALVGVHHMHLSRPAPPATRARRQLLGHCHCAQLELTPATCRVALKVLRRLRAVPASTTEDTSQGSVGLDGGCSGLAPRLLSLVSEGQCRSAACSRGARAKQVKRDPFAATRLPCGW